MSVIQTNIQWVDQMFTTIVKPGGCLVSPEFFKYCNKHERKILVRKLTKKRYVVEVVQNIAAVITRGEIKKI